MPRAALTGQPMPTAIIESPDAYPKLLRIVRATQKYAVPSGIFESCVRMRLGVRNAAWTSHRGHDPEKRAKRMPVPLKRFEMFPAMSTRTKWNDTPAAPGLRRVVRRGQACP